MKMRGARSGPRAALIRPHRDPAFAAASFGRVNSLGALNSPALLGETCYERGCRADRLSALGV